nr:hypothetical protein [Tanacetum cinerariifolium]
YALWDVIENDNSFKPVPQTTANADDTSTSTIPGPVTTEEKVQKNNDVNARSMLLMALPNEHLLTVSQYKDAKNLFEAIQVRFGGNDATKKTLLKQMYENFNTPSTKSLDSIFNRLQKIVSQLAILGENISKEDLNIKFLRSFPSDTNEVDTANIQVNNVSTPGSTVSTHDNTANLSDAIVYAFLANQPNGSQLVHEDLEQIHEDDLEEMDLKWQLDLLSMRARRYFQRTGKKITINESDTAGYEKTKTLNVEDISSKAIEEIDGACLDWSYMADDEAPTNMALMAFSDSEVHNSKTFSNTYLKSFKTLKTQYDNLRIEFNKSEFDLATYKRGLASVKEQLVFYKKNEVMFYDQIAVLKRDASFRDSEIDALNFQIEKLKQEKESNQIKIDNFKNASKSLDNLIGSQISNNSRTSLGLKEFQHPEFNGYRPKASLAALTGAAALEELCLAVLIGQTATGKEFSNPLMAGSLNTVSSKTINSVKQIHAIVDGKAVFISESSVRSDLLFDDEDGITCLTNDEIFENLALMGYEQLLTKLTFEKGKVTLLFDSMLVQNQAPEGEGSTIPPEPEPTPFTSQPTAAKPHNAAPQIVIRLSIRRGDSVKRAITTDASLVAAQDSDNIIKTQTTTMYNVDIPQRMDTGGSPRCQETMGGTPAQTSEQGEVHDTAEPLKDDDDDATLTETLLNIKRSTIKDKGKGIMQETELPKKIKKREMIQLSLDEELAQKLHAEELAKETAR